MRNRPSRERWYRQCSPDTTSRRPAEPKVQMASDRAERAEASSRRSETVVVYWTSPGVAGRGAPLLVLDTNIRKYPLAKKVSSK